VTPAQKEPAKEPAKESIATTEQLEKLSQSDKAIESLRKQKSDPLINNKSAISLGNSQSHIIQLNQPQQPNARKSNILNVGNSLGADLNAENNGNRSPVDRVSTSGFYSVEILSSKAGDKPVLEHIVTVNNYDGWKAKNKDMPVLDHIAEIIRPSGNIAQRQSQQPQPQQQKQSKSSSSSQTPPGVAQRHASFSLGQNAGGKILSSAVLNESQSSSLNSSLSSGPQKKSQDPKRSSMNEERKRRQSILESNGIVRSIATQTDVSEIAYMKPEVPLAIPELPSTKVYAARDSDGNRYSSFEDLANNSAFSGIRRRNSSRNTPVKGRIRRKGKSADKPEKLGERSVIRRREKSTDNNQMRSSAEKDKTVAENVKKRPISGEYAPLE
jgi:hypothetical protein